FSLRKNRVRVPKISLLQLFDHRAGARHHILHCISVKLDNEDGRRISLYEVTVLPGGKIFSGKVKYGAVEDFDSRRSVLQHRFDRTDGLEEFGKVYYGNRFVLRKWIEVKFQLQGNGKCTFAPSNELREVPPVSIDEFVKIVAADATHYFRKAVPDLVAVSVDNLAKGSIYLPFPVLLRRFPIVIFFGAFLEYHCCSVGEQHFCFEDMIDGLSKQNAFRAR